MENGEPDAPSWWRHELTKSDKVVRWACAASGVFLFGALVVSFAQWSPRAWDWALFGLALAANLVAVRYALGGLVRYSWRIIAIACVASTTFWNIAVNQWLDACATRLGPSEQHPYGIKGQCNPFFDTGLGDLFFVSLAAFILTVLTLGAFMFLRFARSRRQIRDVSDG